MSKGRCAVGNIRQVSMLIAAVSVNEVPALRVMACIHGAIVAATVAATFAATIAPCTHYISQ